MLFFFCLLFPACHLTRRVPDNKFLLTQNKLKVDVKKLDLEEMENIIKQKPNRKILRIIPFHLTVNNLVDPEKARIAKEKEEEERKSKSEKLEAQGKKPLAIDFITWREWLLNIGEPPVLLDTLLTKKSSKQLELYLFKKGFFNVSVSDTTIYKKKTAKVFYTIKTQQPYGIRNVNYIINDSVLEKYIRADIPNSFLKKNHNYDEDIITKERERITATLKNNGYYHFAKEYLFFAIDSTFGKKEVDISIEIKNPETRIKDTIIQSKHQQYRISNVFVQTNFDQKKSNGIANGDSVFENVMFLDNGNLSCSANILTQNIFVKKGDIYGQRNMDETYKKISDLKVFKLINIYYEDAKNPTTDTLGLNCYILLSPTIKQSFSTEFTGQYRSGNPGVFGNLVYTNKNSFGGAENLEIRLKGGLEAQKQFNDNNKLIDLKQDYAFFNTRELGPEITLYVPKFLFPINPQGIFKYFKPKTTIVAAYNIQARPDLIRQIVNLSYGFVSKHTTITHFWYPAELNLVDVSKRQPYFDQTMERYKNNQYILRSYQDHITAGGKYIFLYNNQSLRKNKDFNFLRGSVEGAGNILQGIYSLAKSQNKNENSDYILFNKTPYAQFVKVDVDFRYYKIINEKNNVVYRVAVGAGKPLKNLGVLPLEKSYFGGGSNSIRAWAARTLGPGSYRDTSTSGTNPLKIGDINLESNLEYRFPLYKFIKGALFVDAGNIWLFSNKDNEKDRPDGVFKIQEIDKAIPRIALGAGLGLRFDFSFFIFRFDLGVKLRDPMLNENDRVVIQHIFDKSWRNEYYVNKYNSKDNPYKLMTLNFGIGYPF